MGDVTAATIRAALRVHYPSGAYAVLEEVRNGTGYARKVERYADALVCSCWPSRGLWLAGIEIKVSRSDWLSELRDPSKSAEIQQWCDYWWIAAPAGLVREGELPVTWGLLEYDPAARGKDKLVARAKAPKLEPAPMSAAFIASVLRSASSSQEAAIAAAVNDATRSLRAGTGADEVERLRNELAATRARAEMHANTEAALRRNTEELHRLRELLGIRWGGDPAKAEPALSAVRAIREAGPGRVAAQLRAAADALDALPEEVRRG